MATGGLLNIMNQQQQVQPTQTATGGTPAPVAPPVMQLGAPQPVQMPANNVFNTSAAALNNATSATNQGLNFDPSGPMLNRYMNPYTSQVIGNSLMDMNRARQMSMNDIGAQASAAGAFGGSRHGLVEAETNRNFFNQAGNMVSDLRSQNFLNAQNMALAGNQARLGAANQLGNLSNLGFGMGRQINADMNQMGSQQQMLQQALIDAGKAQFGNYANAPQQSLAMMSGALGSVPIPQTQTQSYQPGLMDYAGMGLSAAGMFLL